MKSKLTLLFLVFFALNSARSQAADVGDARFEVLPGVTLVLRASRFVPSKHSVRKVKGHVIVDGHQVMGVDGTMPRTQLDEAYLIFHGRKIRLDTSSLYNVGVEKEHFTASWVEDEPQKEHAADSVITISGQFSDGAGGYTVTWRVVDDTSLRLTIEEA